MEEFNRCPGGHKLPHRTRGAECTPLYCTAGESAPQKPKPPPKFAENSYPDESENEETALARVGENEVRKMKVAAGRFAARLAHLKVPENLEGKAAEEWSDKRLVDLLPLAVAVKEELLKFGDDKQRDKAADDILAANGRGKRDLTGASGPSIVIVSPEGAIKVPWAQRADVVDALKGGNSEKK